MKQTPVCGIDGPLADASNEALERLLDQFGRNGQLSDVQTVKKAEVESILAARAAGVFACKDGPVHHPV